jgi:5S rRNA maturation endonuclease (ribonuclease M5)
MVGGILETFNEENNKMAFATQHEILEIIDQLKENNDEYIIVVEGKNDKAALEHFGIGNIIMINGKDIWNRCEEIAQHHKEIIILTDFDAKGKELYGKVAKNLTRLHTKVNKEYREWFQKRTRVSHIEGLIKYMENRE